MRRVPSGRQWWECTSPERHQSTTDVGILTEGVVILQNLDNIALSTAMLYGLFYSFNMKYPSQLHSTFEVIQKVVMELDM